MLWRRRKLKTIFCAFLLVIITQYFGVFTHLFEKSFATSFKYPYDGDVKALVKQMRARQTPKVAPINKHYFHYKEACLHKCKDVNNLEIVLLVKSAPLNSKQRWAIRRSWGYEKRFTDLLIRTVFLIGQAEDQSIEESLENEYLLFKDLVRANFTDTYSNLTLKTIMGLTWIANYCPHSRFYFFIDDDYYVSLKNLLRFLQHSLKSNFYKNNVLFYGGFVFNSAPHRHRSSKWYISLEDYPYDMWPPYVSSAYVLSREAVLNMYYASLYTKFLRFEDVFMGLLAHKCGIQPQHSHNFHFYPLPYNWNDYWNVVAAHGCWSPERMVTIWQEQKDRGRA